MKKGRNNQLIECIRIIACAFVCFIHCPFPNRVGKAVIVAGRFAVPFFLLVSGYFSYGADAGKKAKKKLKDIICITAMGGIACLVWNCLNSYMISRSFVQWFNPYVTPNTIYRFLFFNRAVFFNSAFYYFFVLIYVYIIHIFVCKYNLFKLFYCLIPVLLAALFTVLSQTPGSLWYKGGNFLFLGIPLFYLGHFLHHEETKLFDKLKGKEIILMVIGTLMSMEEYSLRLYGNYIFVGSIITSVSVLIFCINNNAFAMPKFLVALGSRFSVYVMVLHCEVRDTLRLFLSADTYYFPFLVLLTTLLIACIIHYIFSIATRLGKEAGHFSN